MIKYFQELNWLKLAKILPILIITYLAVIFGFCLLKYFTFNYNGLDLAIFNQTFYLSSLGQFFKLTIHPNSYLGDHFTPILLLLLPFYYLYKSPLCLLFLQSLFLALAVIPLYLIAKKNLTPWTTLLVIVLYLFNPLTWNIALFEFHFLALVPFFIFWVFYFYQTDKFKLFLIMAGLSLLINEDVAFIIFMFGIVALLDRKKTKWIISPLILASAYFGLAMTIISRFSTSAHYKFLIYYQWLGNNFPEILINLFLKFPQVIAYVLNIYNFELLLSLFLVFLFLALIRPKYLLLSLGMLMEMILGHSAGALILKKHYGAVFLTAFTLATIFTLKYLNQNQRWQLFYKKYREVVWLALISGLIYNFFMLGPLPGMLKYAWQINWPQIKLKNDFSRQIPLDASLVTTFDFIANLSARKNIYALKYAYLGWQQYAAGPYIIPPDTQYLLVNFADLVTYNLQYETKLADYYYQADNHLLQVIKENNFQLAKVNQNLALWQKNYAGEPLSLYQAHTDKPEFTEVTPQIINAEIIYLGYKKGDSQSSLFFQAQKPISKNYFLQINDQLIELGYGLYPTSEWRPDQIIEVKLYRYPLTKLAIVDFKGAVEMGKVGDVVNVFDQYTTLTEINFP
jgi:uncharacterized membrane protein